MLSAPASAEDAAPEAAAPAPVATKPSLRWFRIPKAVLVTVLGLALSAWLLPAMTRQWDDRQREHELKAAVVADMATATARALVGGEAIWSGQRLTPEGLRRLGDQWALSSTEIEARLRTYFSSSVVVSWLLYSWALDRFINARLVSAAAALQDAVAQRVKLDPGVSDAAARLLVLGEATDGPAPTFGPDPNSLTPRADRRNLAQLKRMLSSDIARYHDAPMVVATWTALEKSLLGFEQAVADQILRSNTTGFSTTPRDLVHDLLP
jgi:hypothetical protein